MDTHGLRSNDQFKDRIFEAIDSSDILYLFLSHHARHSKWVNEEWRYGFRKKGRGFIDPVPLVDPRKAPPPFELADKHFNDWILIYLEYEKSHGTWARIRSLTSGLNVRDSGGEADNRGTCCSLTPVANHPKRPWPASSELSI
jgi:TIR domain